MPVSSPSRYAVAGMSCPSGPTLRRSRIFCNVGVMVISRDSQSLRFLGEHDEVMPVHLPIPAIEPARDRHGRRTVGANIDVGRKDGSIERACSQKVVLESCASECGSNNF